MRKYSFSFPSRGEQNRDEYPAALPRTRVSGANSKRVPGTSPWGIIPFICAGIIFLSAVLSVNAQDAEVIVTERRIQLEQELDALEKEIAAQRSILTVKQRETVSIERDIAILTAQIEEARLSIRAKNLAIERLGADIGVKTRTIGDLEESMTRGKLSLAQLVRRTNELDSYSLAELMLNSRDLSDFFSEYDSFAVVKSSLYSLFAEVRSTKELTENERDDLDKKRRQEMDARMVIEEKKRVIERGEAEKKYLLGLNREQERAYEKVIQERERRAAEIRSALFALRDTAAIPFGTALELANKAYAATGVRPAFLLAILTQESNLGENVGTCNRPGDPSSKSWQVIMPGPQDKARGRSSRDDQTVFLSLMRELGFDPNVMPLSCPWMNGWGGAMGPSQFIPTTWALYKDRIAEATGHNPPNPWLPEDAIMASATFLSDLGASKGGYSAEREAALRYYAGGNWKKPANAFYGNQVMNHAQDIQENMIDPLNF